MGIIRKGEGKPDQSAPGIDRLTPVDRETGAGALTTRFVTFAPGARTAHTHKVEEAMMVIEGEGIAIIGDEELPIRAGDTLLGPAGIRHGFINTGSVPMKLVVAFPAVDVETFPA